MMIDTMTLDGWTITFCTVRVRLQGGVLTHSRLSLVYLK